MKSSSFLAAKIVVFPNDRARRPLKRLGCLWKIFLLLTQERIFSRQALQQSSENKLGNAQEIRMPTHGQAMYNSINGRLWKRTMWKKVQWLVYGVLWQVKKSRWQIRGTGWGQFSWHLSVCKKAGAESGKGNNGLWSILYRMLQESVHGQVQAGKQICPSGWIFLSSMWGRCGFPFSGWPEQLWKLVKDILNFIRRKFSYQEYRMFTLRFYESDFSFKALGECMGISASAISGKVNTIMDTVRSNRGFSWRSQMLAVEGFIS